MRTLRLTTVMVTLALLLVSCGNNVIVEETHYFKDNAWLRFEDEQFAFNISNNEDCYNVIVDLCFDTNIVTSNTLPLNVDYFSDANELHNFTPFIRLRTYKGQLRGNCVGNYCTVTDTIDRYRFFNTKGTYTYKLKQRTSYYEQHGLSSLTFRVAETKIEKL